MDFDRRIKMKIPKYIRINHGDTVLLLKNAKFTAKKWYINPIIPFCYLWLYLKVRTIKIKIVPCFE